MSRAAFYEIPKAAYLFPQAQRGGERLYPEEKVRQWCIFELIRAYGIRIDELDCERSVKIGSKTYWIDILVMFRGQPWAVIECKKADYKKPAEAMDQAKSYADSPRIKAPFAIYTNGDAWLVERRMNDHWYVIPDLPLPQGDMEGDPIESVMYAIRSASPLLRNLDQRLEGASAKRFLSDLQNFFLGNLLASCCNSSLKHALELMCRVACHPTEAREYLASKLQAACRELSNFKQGLSGVQNPISTLPGSSPSGLFDTIRAEISVMLYGTQSIPNLEVLLLRVAVMLAEYGCGQNAAKPFPVIPQNLLTCLREFLEVVFKLRLNAYLPDTGDTHSWNLLRDECSSFG